MTNQNNRPFADDESYWRTQFNKEDYYEPGTSYDDYSSAYRTGHEGYGKYKDRGFDAAENDLKADWERNKGETKLGWERAKQATRSAWHRLERAMPGDADNDGR